MIASILYKADLSLFLLPIEIHEPNKGFIRLTRFDIKSFWTFAFQREAFCAFMSMEVSGCHKKKPGAMLRVLDVCVVPQGLEPWTL